MANIAANAILTRVREVVDDAAGLLRTISATRFAEVFYPEMSGEEQARRVVTAPAFDVRLGKVSRNPSTPPVSGSLVIYDFELTVHVSRFLNVEHALTDSTRDAVLAAAIVDGDMLMQALSYPGNLTTTLLGTATGILSGCLIPDDSSVDELSLSPDGQPSRVGTTHRFHGYASVTATVPSDTGSPDTIDSVATWHRADLGVTLNGSNVSAWADQIGSANGIQASASLQPAYNTSDTSFGDLPTIQLDGTNDAIALGATSDFRHLHNGLGGSYWLVFRTPSTLSDDVILDSCNTTGANIGVYLYQNSSGLLDFAATAGGSNAFASFGSVSISADTIYHLLVTYSTADGYAIYRNGSLVASGVQANAPSTSNSTTALNFAIRSGGSPNAWWNGRIAEFATFDTVLTAGQRTSLFSYSTARYGV